MTGTATWVVCSTRAREVFSMCDDFWVETAGGERAFKVDGKALRLRDVLELQSASGETLLKIQEKSVRDEMEIERDGHPVATALRSSVSSGWQEQGLIERVVERFGLPVTVFQG